VQVPDVCGEEETPPDIEMTICPYAHGEPPRHAYLRTETPHLRVCVVNRLCQPLKGNGELSLALAENVLRSWTYRVQVPPEGSGQVQFSLPLRHYRAGHYQLSARCTFGGHSYTAEESLWVCPEPDTDGVLMGFLGRNPAIAYRREKYLERLRELGMTVVGVSDPTPELLDACLWYGMPCVTRTHGDPEAVGFSASARRSRSSIGLTPPGSRSPIPGKAAAGR